MCCSHRSTRSTIATAACVATALASGFAAQADASLILQINDTGAASAVDPLPVDSAAAGVISTPLTKSDALSNFSNSSSWPLGRFEATINPDKYATVTIEAAPLNVISFDSVSWSRFGTRTYSGAVIRTSLDGFVADVATGTLGATDVEYDLSGLPDITSPVELRFYFTNEGSDFRELNTGNVQPTPNGTGDGLRFFGSVAVIPEPATATMLVAAAGFAFRRRN